MYKLFMTCLYDKLRKSIDKEKRDNPQIEFIAELVEIQEIDGDFKGIFAVKSSSKKGKIKDTLKIEEKLLIELGGDEYTGTLVDIVENEIHVICYQELSLGKYKLSRLINLNNFMLMRTLGSVKIAINIKNYVVSCFFTCLIRKIEDLIENLTLANLNDDIIILYILSLASCRKETKESVAENLLKEIEEERMTIIWDSLKKSSFESRETRKYMVDIIMDVHDLHDECELKGSEVDLVMKFSNLNINLENKMIYFNKNLNNSQKQAVNEINNSTSYKIIGPPGTGKTS
ncbi:hypothetical protein NGRA_1895, partial [Nosema granulosis]